MRNDIGLANGAPDWWAFMDVSRWQGKTVTLQVDRLPEDSTALSSIEQSDDIKGAENLYHEPLRGQIRFSSKRGWKNMTPWGQRDEPCSYEHSYLARS